MTGTYLFGRNPHISDEVSQVPHVVEANDMFLLPDTGDLGELLRDRENCGGGERIDGKRRD